MAPHAPRVSALEGEALREKLNEVYAASSSGDADADAGVGVMNGDVLGRRRQEANAALVNLSKMACRNGKMVEISLILSGVTGCNSNPSPLGTGAGAVQADLYQIKYMGKESVEINLAANIFVEAHKQTTTMGDNMQKAPPGGTEWFLSLIEHAAGAPDIVDAAAKEQSTLGKGLLALGAANRTVLWRIMGVGLARAQWTDLR